MTAWRSHIGAPREIFCARHPEKSNRKQVELSLLRTSGKLFFLFLLCYSANLAHPFSSEGDWIWVCMYVCVCVWPTFFFNITAKQMKYFTKFERHTQTHTRFLSFFSLSFTFYLLQGPNVSRQSFARVDISFWYMSASDCVNGCMCVFGFERSVCAYSRYKFAFCTVYTCYCKNVYSAPAEIFLLEQDKHKEFNIIKTSIYRWWPLTKAQ